MHFPPEKHTPNIVLFLKSARLRTETITRFSFKIHIFLSSCQFKKCFCSSFRDLRLLLIPIGIQFWTVTFMQRYIFKILFQSLNKLVFITSLQGSPNPPPQPLYRWTRKWRLGRQKTSVGSITGSGGEANCGPRHPGCDESPPACARQECTAHGERARMHPLWVFIPSTWGSSSPVEG